MFRGSPHTLHVRLPLAALLALACSSDPLVLHKVRRVIISPPAAHITQSDTLRLSAQLVDGYGTPVAGASYRWSSADPTVATVDDAGLVQAQAQPGRTVIVVDAGQARGQVLAAVHPYLLIAAGDIATCGSNGAEATAQQIDTTPGIVLAVGDNAYPNGSDAEYADCYHPTWGRFKARTRPVPGNHDYQTPGAAGYYRYFGALAGDSGLGYYSYDWGGWHVVALNSEINVAAGSTQEGWLRADLAAHPAVCTLAYWHVPRFSSPGFGRPSDDPSVAPLWRALSDFGADVVIVGHAHDYERFAPQTADGTLDAVSGLRQFVVGTGGTSPDSFVTGLVAANSEVRNGDTFGVLVLTLHATSYEWRFVPQAGRRFTDVGVESCH